MIFVVADTGPIHYLVLIDAIEVLCRLYDRVVVPRAVLAELAHRNAPTPVRNWASALPSWAHVRAASRIDLADFLGPGEAEAIALAQELRADTVLLDEIEARRQAIRLGLPVSGTVGLLERAAAHGLLDLTEAFAKLSRTTFRIDADLLKEALARDAARRNPEGN